MGAKNGLSKGQIFTIVGGLISIIGVFLPWYSASMGSSTLGSESSVSVNGLGWKSGDGVLLGLVSGEINWEFQGIGVIALGMACIVIAFVLQERMRSLAMGACSVLIIGGGIVNLQSIVSLSGNLFGATMQSGAGYGLYLIVLAGLIASSGGLLEWRELRAR